MTGLQLVLIVKKFLNQRHTTVQTTIFMNYFNILNSQTTTRQVVSICSKVVYILNNLQNQIFVKDGYIFYV